MTTELRELRCRSCGMSLGYTYHAGRLVLWCCQDCARTPGVFAEEERDEVIVEMFLEGRTTPQIADYFGLTYQNVQQILKKWHVLLNGRGTTPGDESRSGEKQTRGKK